MIAASMTAFFLGSSVFVLSLLLLLGLTVNYGKEGACFWVWGRPDVPPLRFDTRKIVLAMIAIVCLALAGGAV